MKHLIKAVDEGSLAQEAGVTAGCCLVSIDGCEIEDIIAYERAVCAESIVVRFETADGELFDAEFEKDSYDTLGITFEKSLLSDFKACKNKCVFCFIDQMPRGNRDRETLHFKDDDWRLSLIMGNYVTLTNVSDEEFSRIIDSRVSPLYISVHSTEPELRKKIMSNPTATRITERLRALSAAGLTFHAQIVLCPNINDGEHLDKTLNDLYDLYPAAQSVAVIPVGLTRHRNGLYPLRTLTASEARHAIQQVEKIQARSKKEHGERFAYASDEMYILAGEKLPAEEEYEYYPQIENGVGLLRRFEYEFLDALNETKRDITPFCAYAVCGVSAYPFLNDLFKNLRPYGIDIQLYPVENNYFGNSVTVSGLVCATDICSTLKKVMPKVHSGTLIIPTTMLRENSDVFLDGMTVKELSDEIGLDVVPLCGGDGGKFIDELFAAIIERPM